MTTANLLFPEISESQAAKYLTHNQALHIIDALLNCGVIDRDLTAPPGSPVNGDVYIPKATATGAWAGKENKLAQWDVTAWVFHTPEEGWHAWIRDEDILAVWSGSAWIAYGSAGGSVTSVAMTVPAEFSVAGSPITSSGTLAVSKANQSANQVYAGPASGGAAAPAFRALVAADIPAQPYDVGSFLEAAPTASQIMLRHVFARQVIFASGLSPSQGVAGTAATAQTDFDIQKNGSSVGTMRFAASGTVASFIMGSQTTFAAADKLTVVAPGTPDATLAKVSFTLSGTR